MSEPHNHVSAGIDDDRRVEDDLNKVADEVANEGMTYRAARIRQGAIQLAFLRQSRTDAQAVEVTDEINKLRAAVEYWRLAAERREARRELTGLDIPEAQTLDTPHPRLSAGNEDDPTASKEWNEGCDFALEQLGKYLGIDLSSITWDGATETVEGDVDAVIGKILRAKFGENWGPDDTPTEPQSSSADSGVLERTVRRYIESAVLWIPSEGVRGPNGLDATETIELLCKRMVAAITPNEPQGAGK